MHQPYSNLPQASSADPRGGRHQRADRAPEQEREGAGIQPAPQVPPLLAQGTIHI